MIDKENDNLVFTGIKGNIFVHYELANFFRYIVYLHALIKIVLK